MKYLIYLCVTLLTLTCSCAVHEETPAPGSRPAAVRLLLRTDSPTRASEEALHDVNLYLFDPRGEMVHHHYATSSAVTLELLPGYYDLYAVANAGRDLGERSIAEVETLECTPEAATLGRGPLPMAARQRIVVAQGGTITVPLQRAAARLDLNYAVVGEFAKRLTIRSVQLCNAAVTMTFFEQSRAMLPAQVTNLSSVPDPGQEYAATWYLLENCQGTVPGITQQGEKDLSRAPALATYVRIEAEVGGAKVVYRIFLGQNNTSDFNVVRNRIYKLDVRILGMNALDARVTTTDVTLAPLRADYEQGQTAYSELRLQCTNDPSAGDYSLRYTREQGSGRLRVNGYLLAPGEDFALHPQEGEVTIPLEYTQEDRGEVRLHLVVRSPEGITLERWLMTSFVKPVPHVVLHIDKTQLYAMDRARVSVAISQRNYTGTYDVTTAGTASLFLNTTADLNPATSFTVPGPGTYNLRLRPEVLGTNPFTVTVRDAEGQTASATATVTGLKRTATFTVQFDSSVEGELSVMVRGDYPVQEDIYLIVKPTLQIRSAGGGMSIRSYSMPVLIHRGRDVAGYTLDLGPQAGQTYFVSSYATTFSRTTSQNGMVDYRVK